VISFQPKNILVTGSAGFVGCNFVQMMLNKYSDIEIISYDKLTYAGNLDNLADVMDNPQHTFIQGDICDRALVAKTLRGHEIDTIVHLAAESHVDNSIAGPEVFFQTNVIGTLSLVDEARKYWQEEMEWGESQCRFHHVSTDEVYGALGKDDPAFTEETPYAPNSPYSASKAGSDHVVRSYFHTYKLPITMSNCSNNYGPYQHQEKLIPVIIKSCLEQKHIPIYGDGSNIRDWLYVNDHCRAIDEIIRNGNVGEAYNVGGDNELSNLELTKKICEQLDKLKPENKSHEKLITFVEDRKGHDWRYAINNEKCCTYLGWKPNIDFQTNLINTILYFTER
jgi:dTDP-glucose 4,6-dehydratase